MDNRTYLATECDEDKQQGFVPDGISDTLTVLWREFSKNIAHDSGFWWMDLGGGWFASEPIMQSVQKMVTLNEQLRARPHQSRADMLIVFDERSMLSVRESTDLHAGFLREFINETNVSGVIADVYRACDLPRLELSRYKFIVFAYNFYMDKATRDIIASLPSAVTVAFSYVAGAWDESGFSLENAERATGHRFTIDNTSDYDFPTIRAERLPNARKNTLVFTNPYITGADIRAIAKSAGCHVYTDTADVTIYGDNRFIGAFNKHAGGMLILPSRGTYRDVISETIFTDTDTIPLPLRDSGAIVLVRES